MQQPLRHPGNMRTPVSNIVDNSGQGLGNLNNAVQQAPQNNGSMVTPEMIASLIAQNPALAAQKQVDVDRMAQMEAAKQQQMVIEETAAALGINPTQVTPDEVEYVRAAKAKMEADAMQAQAAEQQNSQMAALAQMPARQ